MFVKNSGFLAQRRSTEAQSSEAVPEHLSVATIPADSCIPKFENHWKAECN